VKKALLKAKCVDGICEMKAKILILVSLCIFVVLLFTNISYAKIDMTKCMGAWLFDDGNI
jgi:hypothetical protein